MSDREDSPLAARQCIPCRGGVPKLEPEAANALLAQLHENWAILEDHHLQREYSFSDFASALAFVNRVGALAEAYGHHPDLYLTWGKATVQIWTHAIDGLTESDFVLAAKIDQLQT